MLGAPISQIGRTSTCRSTAAATASVTSGRTACLARSHHQGSWAQQRAARATEWLAWLRSLGGSTGSTRTPAHSMSPFIHLPTEKPLMKAQLLFVDDEEALRSLMAEALADHGYEVTTAPNGREALLLLRSKRRFVIVITDFSMPEGVSGLDVIMEATRAQPEARLVVASGLSRSQLPPFPPAVTFVPKPYRLEQLVAAIENGVPRDPHGIAPSGR